MLRRRSFSCTVCQFVCSSQRPILPFSREKHCFPPQHPENVLRRLSVKGCLRGNFPPKCKICEPEACFFPKTIVGHPFLPRRRIERGFSLEDSKDLFSPPRVEGSKKGSRRESPFRKKVPSSSPRARRSSALLSFLRGRGIFLRPLATRAFDRGPSSQRWST